MGPSFSAATEDILAHPLFQDTRRLKHHGADNSVYDHSVATARTAYHMACALGLSDAVLKRANETLSLSDMTLPHRIARLVLLEQIYRAHKICAGEPYHK